MATAKNTDGETTRGMPGLRRILWWLAPALAVLVLIGWFWFQRVVLNGLPTDLSSLDDLRLPTACKVLDRHRNEIDSFYFERRYFVPLAELPPHLIDAVVASEDARFFEHPGIDLRGVARALLANTVAGRRSQGGSTITQQLVKNLLVGKEKTYVRKLREAVLAFRMERTLGKEAILETYLNFVFLGSGNYGVEAAARDYFGVSARDLDTGQAALLVGLIPAPSRYSPRRPASPAAARRQLVLRRMVETGALTEEAAAGFADDPILLPPTGEVRVTGAAYMTQVRRDVRSSVGREQAGRLGLIVETGYDPEVQANAEAAVVRAVRELTSRQGGRGILRTVPPEQREAFLEAAGGLPRDPATGAAVAPSPGDCFEALVTQEGLDSLSAGGFQYRLADTERTAALRLRDGSGSTQARWLLSAGDVVGVCLGEDGTLLLDPTGWAQGAAVVVENDTGHVVALVGGTASRLEGFVRATQARRQPGSAFKPIVYAAALGAGRSQMDSISALSVRLPGARGEQWRARESLGLPKVRMATALAYSSNGAAVRLLLERGPAEVAQLAAGMGVRSPLRSDATLALGSSEVSPLDLAAAYVTIARGGIPTQPTLVRSIGRAEGGVIATAGQSFTLPDGSTGQLPGGEGARAFAPGVARELTEMLQEVVRIGTGRPAYARGRPRAGKTGTTNGSVDTWFAGFTPRHTVVVWIGTDRNRSLGPGESGGRTALPAWLAIVEGLEDPEDLGVFPLPDDVVQIRDADGIVRAVRRGLTTTQGLARPTLPTGPLPPFPGTPAGG